MGINKYTFNQLYRADLQRHIGGGYTRKLLKFFRLCQTADNKLFLQYYRWRFKLLKDRNHIDIYGKCDIGPGLYLGHVCCITINADAVIGKNCNIHKGVTIGQENHDVLIAPNSYVNCDIPSHSIVFGNPCIIKHKEGATDGYVNHKCTIE